VVDHLGRQAKGDAKGRNDEEHVQQDSVSVTDETKDGDRGVKTP